MHRPVKVTHSSYIEGSHTTKNTASDDNERFRDLRISISVGSANRISVSGGDFGAFVRTEVNGIKLFSPSLTLWINKPQCLSLASLSRLALYLHIRLEPTRVEFLAIATNIRLFWKDLPGSNTVAYLTHSQ
jgi:hypothetical protein